MGLRFVYGASGAGKSRYLNGEIIHRAGENPKQNFLVIVPDQFTMQTQKDFVLQSERGGILNIDILSFGRLGHRILEEVGREEVPVLDDTGKSLVLQKVAGAIREELPTLGSFLNKQGYIHEVKSVISEFMQYGVAPADVDMLITYAQKRGALAHKLSDLAVIYKKFMEYIQDRFITTEETLDVLRKSMHKSAILPGSVVVFDGFTGFTPIQYRVIQEMMTLCAEVVVVITLGAGENPYSTDGEQHPFHLSKKTIADLTGLCKQCNVERERDIFVCEDAADCGMSEESFAAWEQAIKGQCDMVHNACHRFKEAAELKHLEQSLFRYRNVPFESKSAANCIRIFESTTPAEAVHQTGLFVKELVRREGIAYRDVAIIMGDLEGYAPYVETEFAKMDIPCYVDRTRQIVLNPMVEFVKSGLELFLQDFSYEAVFHFLRSGLAGFDPEEVDILENYVLRTGVKGFAKYNRLFTRPILEGDEGTAHLETINELRQRFMDKIAMLKLKDSQPVEEYINCLYDFLIQNAVQEKLASMEQEFEEQGQAVRAREYAQIYKLIMQLLEQIYELLKGEVITLQEFADILEAGFGEIEVGTIPQNVDRILVGDMERTRLKEVKVLFFLGVNDGNIPKNAAKGGIISDMDREFLRESGKELAPSPRQQMFIQRFYLYLNMTKPSERLYLSYVKMNSAGKSVRPAYLIETVQKMFPDIETEYPELREPLDLIVTKKEGARYLASGLRDYAAGILGQDEEQRFYTLYHAYDDEDYKITRDILRDAAFKRYQESGLPKLLARALYTTKLENSVTRLETFAACAYRHFLQYGLGLKEREEFSLESRDLGNIYHDILESFAGKLSSANHTWFDFDEEFAKSAVHASLEECAASYGSSVLYSSYRNEYMIVRMERILLRTVNTIQRQLKKGSFHPEGYELSFRFADNFESVNVSLSEEEKMRLRGRIDRVDVAEDEEHVFVKVVDYKSGDKHFDLAALYYGLQLQLVVYMNAALEIEKKKHPDKEVIPAAILYYHIDDPAVEATGELSEEELGDLVASKLRMNGIVNRDPGIVERIDGEIEDTSDVIPVGFKKGGDFTAASSVMTGEELQIMSDFVSRKVVEIGKSIMDGTIDMNPYEEGSSDACKWCPYRKVCGFDAQIPGCKKRKLSKYSQEELLQMMQEGGES